jgi:hypothetical protein
MGHSDATECPHFCFPIDRSPVNYGSVLQTSSEAELSAPGR